MMGGRRAVRVALGLGLALLGPVLWAGVARGDGGTLREWQRRGPFEIAVFTEPTPLVAGWVDISVLVLDAATGTPVPSAGVTVEIAPHGRPGPAARYAATAGAATNKLLRAAVFELREPGRYDVTVHVERQTDRANVPFRVDAGRASAPRGDLWLWILWPGPVIAVYGAHRALVARRR